MEIKSQLKLTYKIDISFINSIEELSSQTELENIQRQIEASLEKEKQKYLSVMNEAINMHKKEIAQQDEKTRDVLKFISSIGFDIIPKDKTDQIIREVKS